MRKVVYNGYEFKDRLTNKFVTYEFVYDGFTFNYSKVIIRHYLLKNSEFLFKTVYYKNSFLFKRFLKKYLELLSKNNDKNMEV